MGDFLRGKRQPITEVEDLSGGERQLIKISLQEIHPGSPRGVGIPPLGLAQAEFPVKVLMKAVPAVPLCFAPEEIPGNGLQPLEERGSSAEFLNVLIGEDEGFVRDVIDQMGYRGKECQIPSQAADMEMHEVPESIELPLLDVLDEILLEVRLRVALGHRSRSPS
jgi:hypothetical protein